MIQFFQNCVELKRDRNQLVLIQQDNTRVTWNMFQETITEMSQDLKPYNFFCIGEVEIQKNGKYLYYKIGFIGNSFVMREEKKTREENSSFSLPKDFLEEMRREEEQNILEKGEKL